MNMKLLCALIFSILLLALAGCQAPTCYPPNKILDNKCCIDDDNNSVCDYEEPAKEQPTDVPKEAPVETAPVEEVPTIQKVTKPKTEPAVVDTETKFGKQTIAIGEPKKYLQIDDLSAFKISNDKGIMDQMVLTVRNIGDKTLNPNVELLFEKGRLQDYQANIKQEFTIPALKPGEKFVVKESLGIKFADVNMTRKMTLAVYDRFSAPREDLELLTKQITPTNYMVDLEVHTYGLPETN